MYIYTHTCSVFNIQVKISIPSFQTNLRGDSFLWLLWWNPVCYIQLFLAFPILATPSHFLHFNLHFSHALSHLKFLHHLIFEDYFMPSYFQMVTFSSCEITQSPENIGCVNYSCLQRSLLLIVLLVELVAWTCHQKESDAAAQDTYDFANILCLLPLFFHNTNLRPRAFQHRQHTCPE